MKGIALLVLICFAAVTGIAGSREVTKPEAQAFMRELLASALRDQSKESPGHPHLLLSLSEASRAGVLTFTLIEGDDVALGRPALAAWHGEILQDQKKAFGFRLRRNATTQEIEIYHFWTIRVPKGLKVIRGFIVHQRADPGGTDNSGATPLRV